MKKLLAITLAICLALCAGLSIAETPAEVREDRVSVTKHQTVIKGQEISYTATAGTMAMDTELGQYDMFYTAYTRDDVEDPASRPIIFAYNGGPGVASLYVNIGLFGPDQIDLDENGMLTGVPTLTKTNEYSLLDLADLVFIDPVGTGYSRAAEGTDPKVFWDYQNDIRSVGDFIRVYINRNSRWASPKYLAGESYGTVRTAGLCNYLLNSLHIQLNGLMMISSCNNYAAAEFMKGNDLPYATFLPTYAAIAWYHHKADQAYQDMALDEFLDSARAFAGGEYWSAIFRGDRLTEEEKDALAEKMAGYIGLSKELILQKHLRVDMDTFCSGLLADQKLTVGRTDGRYTGPTVAGSMDNGDADPSLTGISEAFANAWGDILTRKLNVQSDLYYDILSDPVNDAWTFRQYQNSILSQENIIHDCMSKNKFLKVWVLCGYYDLATPFYGAEWTYSHLFLDSSLQKNLTFTYYPSGHMFYLHEPSYRQFRQDAEAWLGF